MAKPPRSGPRKTPKPGRSGSAIAAASFKARCLELMDHVRETGTEYVITKHGQPVARLVPYSTPRRSALFGALDASVLSYDRPFDPVDGEWGIERG